MEYGKLTRKNIETLERLAETPEGVAALTEFVEKQKEARSAYKRYVKIINKKEKTPNEIRAAFIKKCKRYIEMHGRGVTFYKGEDEEEAFIATKGTLYGVSCTEGVRNEYIGKANAIAWLFKDYNFVDETRNAPQPTVAVGQVIEVLDYYDKTPSGVFDVISGFNEGGYPTHDDGMYTSDYKIINDTNAIYEEEEK